MKEVEVKIFNLLRQHQSKIVLFYVLAILVAAAIWGFNEGYEVGNYKFTH